jgi:hypothetical protein
LKGWQFALCAVTKWSIRCTSCLTLVNEPRRMPLSMIGEKKRSTWLSQELQVGMVHVPARPSPQLRLDLRVAVGGVVVDDAVDVQLGRHGMVDLAKEGQEFLQARCRWIRSTITRSPSKVLCSKW